jgi:hypothetical protein
MLLCKQRKNIIIVYKNVPIDEQEATPSFSTIGFTENQFISTETDFRTNGTTKTVGATDNGFRSKHQTIIY